jgi:hypothetical protein
MNSHSLHCPFCHTDVACGAKLCPGCHAILQYGVPDAVYGVTVILSVMVGFAAATQLSELSPWAGAGIGLVIFMATCALVRLLYRNRVAFRRLHDTLL